MATTYWAYNLIVEHEVVIEVPLRKLFHGSQFALHLVQP
jgi:hypothetical protein